MMQTFQPEWAQLDSLDERFLNELYPGIFDVGRWESAAAAAESFMPGATLSFRAEPYLNADDIRGEQAAPAEKSDMRRGHSIFVGATARYRLLLDMTFAEKLSPELTRRYTAFLDRMQPHIAQAFDLTKRNLHLAAQNMLKESTAPAFALSADGRVVLFNSLADRLMGTDWCLAVARDGRLSGGSPKESIDLRNRVRSFAREGSGALPIVLAGDKENRFGVSLRAVSDNLRHIRPLMEVFGETEPVAIALVTSLPEAKSAEKVSA